MGEEENIEEQVEEQSNNTDEKVLPLVFRFCFGASAGYPRHIIPWPVVAHRVPVCVKAVFCSAEHVASSCAIAPLIPSPVNSRRQAITINRRILIGTSPLTRAVWCSDMNANVLYSYM